MADPISDQTRLLNIVKEAGKTPQYQELMDYLMVRRAVPPISFHDTLDTPDTGGRYVRNTAFGTDLPQQGAIELRRDATSDTLVHELTHAAVYNIVNQYAEQPSQRFSRSPVPNQFTAAVEKIMTGTRKDFLEGKDSPPIAFAKLLNPAWTAKNRGYRALEEELFSFAMGNNAPPEGYRVETDNPLHLDATLATQFMMLLDLAKRDMAKRPQSQGR